MSRRRKDPLRPLTAEERRWLERISRSRAEPAGHVARAEALLAVADGRTYTEAAVLVGRRVGDTVAAWVARFNREGLGALEPGHGGGSPVRYGAAERARILAEVRRPPDRARDGTATWSVATLGRTLRRVEDGLPGVSDDTVWRVLRAVGLTWQQDRSWCETGVVLRKRKAGVVEVVDPDAAAKKSSSRGRTRRTVCRCGRKMKPGRIRHAPIPDNTGSRAASRHATPMSTSARARPSSSPCSARRPVSSGPRA